MKPEVVFVIARASNGVIGRDGKLPWHISEDLKRFKRLTLGTPMIMGRKTFDSLPGLLPNRRHIVLTRDPAWQRDGAEIAHSVEEALRVADADRVTVIGGAEIFELFKDVATAFELTEVHEDSAGDTVIPPPDPEQWREVWREDHPATEKNPAFSWVRLERR
jgi:dihydrofolate reductase